MSFSYSNYFLFGLCAVRLIKCIRIITVEKIRGRKKVLKRNECLSSKLYNLKKKKGFIYLGLITSKDLINRYNVNFLSFNNNKKKNLKTY